MTDAKEIVVCFCRKPTLGMHVLEILHGQSLEMPLINCKVKLKLKQTKYCLLSAEGNENVINDNDNANNIFTTKDTKLYVPVVTLSVRNNQKLSKLVSKGFERSVYWNEYKTNRENKNTTNEYRYI